MNNYVAASSSKAKWAVTAGISLLIIAISVSVIFWVAVSVVKGPSAMGILVIPLLIGPIISVLLLVFIIIFTVLSVSSSKRSNRTEARHYGIGIISTVVALIVINVPLLIILANSV